MDRVPTEQRSLNMAAVRSRNTTPEIAVRSMLHSLGLRFRLHQSSLPGSPDVVLKKHGAVVLVHGCFWHGHSCPRGALPASRQEFWLPKLEGNQRRDLRQVKELRALGWRVLTVWECETRNPAKLRRRMANWFGVGGST
jgi:DNA mismatch endonuclease, patch repair protein